MTVNVCLNIRIECDRPNRLAYNKQNKIIRHRANHFNRLDFSANKLKKKKQQTNRETIESVATHGQYTTDHFKIERRQTVLGWRFRCELMLYSHYRF